MNYPDARRRALAEQENEFAAIGLAIMTIIIGMLITVYFVNGSSSHSRPAQKPTTQVTQSHQAQTSRTSMSINPGGPVRGLKTHS